MDTKDIKQNNPDIENLDVLPDDGEERITELGKEEIENLCEDNEAKLKKEIEELQKEINKLKNDYALAYADTENMRKRLMQEAETTRKYRIQSFALEILPVIDNFERALAQEMTKENEAFYKGIEMIYKQLIETLKKEGVTEIETEGKEFDPNFHQAIMMEKVEGVKPGIVTQVLQKGYMLKDRILRASMVKVSE